MDKKRSAVGPYPGSMPIAITETAHSMLRNPLEILYIDEHVAAVNKPPGLLVHRSNLDRHESDFALQRLRNQIGRHVYPVHRLDRPTSGVLLFALSPEAAQRASASLASEAAAKTYLAVVRGVTADEFVIDYPLHDPEDRFDVSLPAIENRARNAITCCRKLGTAEIPHAAGPHPTSRYSLLKVSLNTGRRHQIRRHLKHVFHPVIGDTTYGDGRHNRLFREILSCTRMLLHSAELTFPHPWSGKLVTISAAIDGEFGEIINMLGWRTALLPR